MGLFGNWNPFRDSWHIPGGKKVAGTIAAYTPLTGFGALNTLFPGTGSGPLSGLTSSGAKLAGVETPASRAKRMDAESESNAAVAADEKQALFDASAKEGLERLALKRKRGFGASVIVQPTSSAFGSGSTFGG